MTKPTIHLVFVDDWELRGNGSGDARELQFKPLRKLVEIYNEFGIRGSFNAEVLQQITFRAKQDEHPELRELADEWEESVKFAYSNGHDVQLHVHPQWKNARYDNGKWELTSDWSILNYSSYEAMEMLQNGKDYLEQLLRQLDPAYRCLSFRSGSWCIAPSPFILNLLVKLGIVFDMSIVGGVSYENRHINLDYTRCEEDFLPYYPVMTDARKVSRHKESIVCVPTNCFYASRQWVFRRHLSKVKQKLLKSDAAIASATKSGTAYSEWEQTTDSRLKGIVDKAVVPYLKGKHFISDLAQLDSSMLAEMLGSIRRRAKSTGLSDVPVVLENHTKDIGDFTAIRNFIREVAQAPDIRFLTLTDLARRLQEGQFQIRTA
jgi:hypothetical protein